MAKKVTGYHPYNEKDREEYIKKWHSMDYIGENYNSLVSSSSNHLLDYFKIEKKIFFASYVVDKYRKEIKNFEDKLLKQGIIIELFQTTGQLDASALIKLNADLKQLLEDYKKLRSDHTHLESVVLDVLNEHRATIPNLGGWKYGDLRILGKQHTEALNEVNLLREDVANLGTERNSLVKDKNKLIEASDKQLQLIKELKTQVNNLQLENKGIQKKLEEANFKSSKMGWSLINLEEAAGKLVGKKLELPIFKERFLKMKQLFLTANLTRVWNFIEENFLTLFSVMEMLEADEQERERESSSEEGYETADEGEDDGDNGQTGEHDSNKGGTCSVS